MKLDDGSKQNDITLSTELSDFSNNALIPLYKQQ